MIRDAKILEAYVRDLLDRMPDANFMVHASGRIVLANALLEKMLGYESQELVGKPIDALIPERFRGPHAGYCADYSARPRTRAMGVGLDLRALCKDGTELPVEISLSPIESDEGTFVIGSMRDISQSEERYRAIFEQVAVGVVHSNLEGRILNANPQFLAMTGYTREEALTIGIRELTHPDDIEKSIDARKHVLLEATSDYAREVRLIRKDGTAIWTHITTSLIRGADRRPQHFISVIHNIDEQKHAERARNESEERFRAVLEQSIAAIYVLQDDRIVYVNARMREIFGYGPDEVFDPNPLAHVKENDWSKVIEQIRQRLAGGGDPAYTITALRKDHSEFTLGVNATRAVYDGRPAIIAVAQDITERERAAEALQRSQKHLRDLIDGLGPSIFVGLMTPQGILIEANRPALAAAGLKPEDVLDRPFEETYWWSYSLEIQQQLRESIARAARGEALRYDVQVRAAENHLIDVDFALQPVRDETGEVVYLVPSGNVITERKRSEAALKESEAKYRHLIEQAADGIFISDAQGNYLLANSRCCELLGYTEDELLGMNSNVTYPEEDRKCHAMRMKAVAAGRSLRFERMVKRKDGSLFPAEISLKKIDTSMVQVIFHDITERRTQEQKIARLTRIHAVLSGINSAIVRIRDRGELFREACRIIVEHGRFTLGWIGVLDHASGKVTAVAQVGLPENSGVGSTFFNGLAGLVPWGAAVVALREKRAAIDNVIEDAPGVMDAKNKSDTMAVRRAAIKLGAKSVIVLPLIVEGKTFGILTLYAPERDFFSDEEKKLLNELAGDIAFAIDHIDKQERLDYLAYYDELTGLANRSLILERVAQYMRSAVGGGYKLALFLIDLERFKNINDSLGRPAGDALLKQVADWLARKAGDVNLVARVGADHFAVVLPEVKQDGDVVRLLEKTMEGFLDHAFRLNDAVYRIAAKVGVALFPDDGADADTLFRNAEAALKKAKASGDRYLFYTQRMTEAVSGKLTLENQLHQALDNEEFVLHYQPKVNLASGKLTGAEALIRWNDPRTGLVPPGRFIPILEETGLIYDVGRWALRQAIADYLRWRSAGLPAVRIAVNVSPLQLRNHGFIAEIRQAIGIDAHAAAGLELEITESLIMEDVRHSIASLQAIRAMGVSVAIDDFGTGFSSLSYLAKLPVDTLKIDRSFVTDMTAAPEGLALVSTIINLAHSLKLKVVAEGVETEEQSRLLRLLNCDEMQGYLFSKPVPGEVFETKFLAPRPGG